MIFFNADGSGVLISDVDSKIRQTFAAGISQLDILSIKNTFDHTNEFKGTQQMTNVIQFGSDYLAGVRALVNAIEAMRVMRERTVSDTGLFAAYLASPGARTDLQLIDLQNADSALVQLLFTFDSGAPTNKSELF